TLPADPNKKLAFLAGGIGVTPFRSMIKYLTDTNQMRDIIMLYSNKTIEDIAYKEVFDEAQRKLGIVIHYPLGPISKELLMQSVPDFKERVFYISGPKSMVDAFKKTL